MFRPPFQSPKRAVESFKGLVERLYRAVERLYIEAERLCLEVIRSCIDVDRLKRRVVRVRLERPSGRRVMRSCAKRTPSLRWGL